MLITVLPPSFFRVRNRNCDGTKALIYLSGCVAGIDMHFIHVKPSYVPHGRAVQPLLMVHGWPGSFYEFYKTIALLTEPAGHGLNEGDMVFEVICPSIPGYGFSEAPHQKGER